MFCVCVVGVIGVLSFVTIAISVLVIGGVGVAQLFVLCVCLICVGVLLVCVA